MQTVKLNRNFFTNIFIINLILLFVLLSMRKELMIFSIIHSVAILYLILLVNYYFFYLKKVTLEVHNDYITIYKNNIYQAQYKMNEILTDEKRWAYVFNNNFILFQGILHWTVDKKTLENYLHVSKDFKIIKHEHLFKTILKNKYFTSALVAFLIVILNYVFSIIC